MENTKHTIIFLVDMNSFFVTCELTRHPEYKKQPLVIASRNRRSVITAASYKAKEKGIDSASNLHQALMKIPDLIVVDPDIEFYRQKSKQIMAFLGQFTPNMHVASVDEAYLDVTHYFIDTKPTKENINKLAAYIQARLLKELGFPCNIGISTTKFLAKMASELQKPFVIESIFIKEIEAKLWPLPIGKMHGIGKKTSEVLRYINIQTIGDFASFPNTILLQKLLGNHILEQQEKAQGIFSDDNEEVKMRKDRISISKSRTFLDDIRDAQIIEIKLQSLWSEVVDEVKEKKQKVRNIKVFYKKTDFQTMQRSLTLDDYTNDFNYLYKTAQKLFSMLWDGEDIRLLGIGVSDFIQEHDHAEQLSMFELPSDELHKKVQQEKKTAALKMIQKNYNIITGDEFAKNRKED